MKLKIFIASIIFSVCIFSSPANSSYYSVTKIKIANDLSGTITYERVFFDGLWWIIVLEDGVKIQQYVDPNQY